MMKTCARQTTIVTAIAVLSLVAACGRAGGGHSTPGPQPPGTPTALLATVGNAQVSLTWAAVSGATNYAVRPYGTTGSIS